MPLALDEVWRNSILGCGDCQVNFPSSGWLLGRLGVGLLCWVGGRQGFIKRTRSCREFTRSFSERRARAAAVRVGQRGPCPIRRSVRRTPGEEGAPQARRRYGDSHPSVESEREGQGLPEFVRVGQREPSLFVRGQFKGSCGFGSEWIVAAAMPNYVLVARDGANRSAAAIRRRQRHRHGFMDTVRTFNSAIHVRSRIGSKDIIMSEGSWWAL
jgi:hypothetical protein